MPGAFSGIELASRALQTDQSVIEIIGHNIANANTTGYTRQRGTVSATEPYTISNTAFVPVRNQVGTGVQLTDIERVRDQFIDHRLQSANSDQSQYNQLRDILQRVQDAYTEPGEGGLSSQLTAFFNSFQQLSQKPEDGSLRFLVRHAAESLTNRFNQASRDLDAVSSDVTGRVQSGVQDVNRLSKQVAALNLQISNALNVGEHPNDLQDRRDELVKQIVGYTGAQVVEDQYADGRPTGNVNIFVNGFAVVQGKEAIDIPSTVKTINGQPSLTDGTNVVTVRGGSIAGLFKAQGLIADYKADLNATASTLITSVNQQHRAGFGLDGLTNRDFFSGTDAASIGVSSAIEGSVDAIAAATPPTAGNPVSPGNGDNARAIADIANAKVVGSFTLGQFYASNIGKIGADVQTANQQSSNQTIVVQQLQNLRNSVSGVSIDEEATHLQQYQRSYQAAARLVSVFDEMLDRIINGMGAGK